MRATLRATGSGGWLRTSSLLTALALFAGLVLALAAPRVCAADLEQDFRAPPASTKPWVYWYWINGNISKDGIRADLEDMKRVGIGGAFIMDGSIYLPPGPVRYGSDAWHAHVQHAIAVGEEVGVEIGIMNCAGWATSGGPWNDLEHSMKQLVWSETSVAGGAPWQGALPRAEATKLDFFREIAVLAIPEPEGAAGSPRIGNLETKSGLKGNLESTVIASDDLKVRAGIEPARIIDLTARLGAGGRLEWTPPAGRWTILRFGYTTTGRTNHPAPPEGTGFEVDKLDGAAVTRHLEHSLGRIMRDAGPRVGRSLTSILCDSWEAGTQNWTAALPVEFERRRGYALRQWLPCLAGRVVSSAAESEAFLEDFRRTLGDLYAEMLFGTLQRFAHDRGLRVAAEAYGGAFDEFKMQRHIDRPMVEFWMHDLFKAIGTTTSAANTLGEGIVMAEAFTSRPPLGRWQEHPATLKLLGDAAQAAGVNRFALHCYVHQPRTDLAPGFTLGRYGSHFGRLNSWWSLAPAWIEYLRRSHALLQSGETVADLLFLYPERLQSEQRDLNSPSPAGYHGFSIAPFQLAELTVERGVLRLPRGTTHQLLVLPERWTASVETLRHLARLQAAGAMMAGPAPFAPATLVDRQLHQPKWNALVAQLWPSPESGVRTSKPALAALLEQRQVPADFRVLGPDAGADVRFIHRRSGATDCYFVTNQAGRAVNVDLEFRVTGRTPEIWDASTGCRSDAAPYEVGPRHTRVPFTLGAADSVFVIFRKPLPKAWPVSITREGTSVRNQTNLTADGSGALPWAGRGGVVHWSDSRVETGRAAAPSKDLEISGPWAVAFQAGRGAPELIALPRLRSLSQDEKLGVRYFSGLATYRTTFQVPAELIAAMGARRLLDLGSVGDLARVELNGHVLGTLWKPPFVIDVTAALRPGANDLVLTVANRWVNRLIGDEALPADARYDTSSNPNTRGALLEFPDWWSDPATRRTSGRVSFAVWKHFAAGDALVDSGLLGPVRLRSTP